MRLTYSSPTKHSLRREGYLRQAPYRESWLAALVSIVRKGTGAERDCRRDVTKAFMHNDMLRGM